jgi:hypothetical protein
MALNQFVNAPYHSLPDQIVEHYGNDAVMDDLTLEYLVPQLPTIGLLASSQTVTSQSFNLSPAPHTSQPHHGLETTSSFQNIVRTSMGPPTRTRKRKAPTLRAEDWEPYKARIIELHIQQDLPLQEVKDAIQIEFGFEAKYAYF